MRRHRRDFADWIPSPIRLATPRLISFALIVYQRPLISLCFPVEEIKDIKTIKAARHVSCESQVLQYATYHVLRETQSGISPALSPCGRGRRAARPWSRPWRAG